MCSIHPGIAAQLQHVYVHGPPEWMTTGRTVLMVKDASRALYH